MVNTLFHLSFQYFPFETLPHSTSVSHNHLKTTFLPTDLTAHFVVLSQQHIAHNCHFTAVALLLYNWHQMVSQF